MNEKYVNLSCFTSDFATNLNSSSSDPEGASQLCWHRSSPHWSRSICCDGDILRVATGGKTLTVRLACVDAAETAQAPFGKAAAERLRQLLPLGQQVSLRVTDTDRYGRSVAKVYKGNLSINLALVQEGQAVVYREYLNACPELRERRLRAEANAKSRRIGFWN